MSDEFAKASELQRVEKKVDDLQVELLGNYPRRDKDDLGRIGQIEKSIDELPRKMLTNWRSMALAVVSLGTFLILIYKTFVKG